MLQKTLDDQFRKIGSTNTRFWMAGDTGPPVLLIHGIGGSVEEWRFNIGALAEHHRVYAFDMVGFGRSDKPAANYSFSYLAQFIRSCFKSRDSQDWFSLSGCLA